MSEAQDEGGSEEDDTSSLSVTNYDQLVAKLFADGRYVIANSNYSVAFSGTSSSESADLAESSMDAVAMTLSNEISTLTTLVTRETFEAAENLDALAEMLRLNPQEIYDPSAEIQYIEHEINTHLGIDPAPTINFAIQRGFPDGGFTEDLSKECVNDQWRASHLRTIFDCLINYRSIQHSFSTFEPDQSVRDVFPELNDFSDLMDHHFTQGFLLARLISEYFTRFEIGPLAVKGLASEGAQERRTSASGQRSNQKKHLRIEMLLTRMEYLISRDPVVARFGLKEVAKVALEDCIGGDPNLWRQGKKQLDQYLDEMVSDIRYQDRYVEIKGETA
jgi:hypothetical protein